MTKKIVSFLVGLAAFCAAASPRPEAIRLPDTELALGEKTVQKVLKFPGLKKADGYIPVLKARIFFKSPQPGGWTPCGIIRLNNKNFTPLTAARQPRLLRRGSSLQFRTGKKLRKAPYFQGGKLVVMYGSGKENALDRRIASSREDGFRYYFDISDLVSYGEDKTNTLLLGTTLTLKITRNRNRPINFRDMKILFVKESELTGLRRK